MNKEKRMESLTRRDFLKKGSLAGLAGAASFFAGDGCASALQSPEVREQVLRIPRRLGRGNQPVNPKFPNIGGFVTLLADLHQHTVFSDGDLRPGARVEEAKREGLDVICLSDHVEVRPFKADIANVDLGRAYELALPKATTSDILLIPGLEITRSEPYAKHLNTLFLKDFNALITEKFEDAVRAAAKQEAFIFWNHPAWGQKEPKATWYPQMDEFLKEGMLHGFEVVNGFEGDARDYQPDVMDWCQKHRVTMLGNSDAHKATAYLTDWSAGEHRPMTLIFARDRSVEAVREALFAGRTAIYYYLPGERDLLIGDEKWLLPIFNRCFNYTPKQTGVGPNEVIFENDLPFTLELKTLNTSGIKLPEKLQIPHGSSTFAVETLGGPIRVEAEVLNFHIGKERRMNIELSI